MTLVRFVARLGVVTVWILFGLLCVSVVFPLLPSVRAGVTRWWSRWLMMLCGVAVRVVGQPVLDRPSLWVANHVSWVDIFVLNSVRGVSFVSKSEVRRWPVIGWLVAGAGTVFLDRGRRQAIRAVAGQMGRRFARGEAVGLFPEGTSSDGFDVGPFHASLFEPAIEAGVDVQPVALRFMHRGRRSGHLAFVGEQTLARNVWLLLGTTGAGVEAVFLPVIGAADCRGLGRAGVASRAHAAVRRAVRARAGSPAAVASSDAVSQ
ncbi:MAG: 1-acyl-sn-glycerol-3-phosphate acyltransferase [Candidimonas sp.]|nr:MAG: 1-acyl-sn-glycerol-3-phosphate acyltransferase [Candidimonas sp.]